MSRTFWFVHVQKRENSKTSFWEIASYQYLNPVELHDLEATQLPVHCAHCMGMKTISGTTMQADTDNELITSLFTHND